MLNNNFINNYFYFLLIILPISIIIGPAISLLNIIIFDISFLLLILIKREFKWINNFYIKVLFFFYLYLIINTFLSLDPALSFQRNFGFLRLIIFFIGVNYFFFNKQKNKKIFLYWTYIICFVAFDVFIESLTGQNIFGFSAGSSIENERIVSFFKDEAIAGSFIYGFSFIIIGYQIYKIKKIDKKNLFLLFSLIFIFFLATVFTGERSNSIKFLISLFFFICLFKISLKFKIYFFSSLFFFLTIFISANDYLKERVYATSFAIKTYIQIFNDPYGKGRTNPYASLNRSGYEVFKKYPLFGVGNKNYRFETCKQNSNKLYICETHPHQIYFEFLSEHGIVGTIIILGVIFLLLFKILNSIIRNREYICLGCLVFLIVVFTPILPSGSFFSNYNITLFFINLSVMFACNSKMNIFNQNK